MFYIEAKGMIYGYELKTINESGLRQMREICIDTSPSDLRRIAHFLLDKANEAEQFLTEASANSMDEVFVVNWHRHLPEELTRRIGCDIIIAVDSKSAVQ